MLILVAIIGIASVTTIQTGSILQRRAAEEELLEIGSEFRHALISYANATPAGQRRAPGSLQDLIKDPRYPNTRRHLRKIYADPMTGKEEWGIVEALDGSGIIGVYSLSNAKPIKIGDFNHPFRSFSGKESYREWQFTVTDPLAQALSSQSIPRPRYFVSTAELNVRPAHFSLYECNLNRVARHAETHYLAHALLSHSFRLHQSL